MMKVRYRRIVQILASGVLGLLGFSACSDENGVEEYGTPTISYTTSGLVTDESGSPIKGIQVVDNYEYAQPDTTYTNAKGEFTIVKGQVTGWKDENFKSYKIKFKDVDGESNGSFKNDSASINEMTLKQTEDKTGSWNFGSYAISLSKKLKKADGSK